MDLTANETAVLQNLADFEFFADGDIEPITSGAYGHSIVDEMLGHKIVTSKRAATGLLGDMVNKGLFELEDNSRYPDERWYHLTQAGFDAWTSVQG